MCVEDDDLKNDSHHHRPSSTINSRRSSSDNNANMPDRVSEHTMKFHAESRNRNAFYDKCAHAHHCPMHFVNNHSLGKKSRKYHNIDS